MNDVARSWAAWFRVDVRRIDGVIAISAVFVSMLLIAGAPQDLEIAGPEIATSIAAFAMLLFRRRWPRALLALSVVWSALHALWRGPSSLPAAALVLLATVCTGLSRRAAIVLGAVVGISLYGVALILNDEFALGDGRTVIALVWAAAAVGVADAVRSWNSYRTSAEMQLRTAVLAADTQARQQVVEERLMIARDVHDLLAHNLSVIIVQNGAALHLLRDDPDRAEHALSVARDAGRNVLDELRGLLGVLRGAADADAAPRSTLPTVEDLDSLVETMRSTGLHVTWNDSGRRRPLAPVVSLAAYRIVQEALTNAARYGDGSAQLITSYDEYHLEISVTNPTLSQGQPIVGLTSGLGIIGMRERALAIGGTFEAGFTNSGFGVRAELPVAISLLGRGQ